MRSRAMLLGLLLLCACVPGCHDDPADPDDGPDGSGDGPGDGSDDGPGPAEGECGALPVDCQMECPSDLNLSWCAYEPYPPPEQCQEICATGSCCSCVELETNRPEWATTFIDCTRPSCPNAIASDENCGSCMKDWGSGASYCADPCTTDEECTYAENPWASIGLSLVCHPDGYCTRPCATDDECSLTGTDSYTCDPSGACSFCVDCT